MYWFGWREEGECIEMCAVVSYGVWLVELGCGCIVSNTGGGGMYNLLYCVWAKMRQQGNLQC